MHSWHIDGRERERRRNRWKTRGSAALICLEVRLSIIHLSCQMLSPPPPPHIHTHSFQVFPLVTCSSKFNSILWSGVLSPPPSCIFNVFFFSLSRVSCSPGEGLFNHARCLSPERLKEFGALGKWGQKNARFNDLHLIAETTRTREFRGTTNRARARVCVRVCVALRCVACTQRSELCRSRALGLVIDVAVVSNYNQGDSSSSSSSIATEPIPYSFFFLDWTDGRWGWVGPLILLSFFGLRFTAVYDVATGGLCDPDMDPRCRWSMAD